MKFFIFAELRTNTFSTFIYSDNTKKKAKLQGNMLCEDIKLQRLRVWNALNVLRMNSSIHKRRSKQPHVGKLRWEVESLKRFLIKRNSKELHVWNGADRQWLAAVT